MNTATSTAEKDLKNYFYFPQKLLQGTIKEKKFRFVSQIIMPDGEEERCFFPTTVPVDDYILTGLPCLLQPNANPGKTKYTVKAISIDEGKSWIGIDMNFSNRIVEYFIKSGALRPLLSKDLENFQREKTMRRSKLDFKIDDLWLEVKTPLDTVHRTPSDTVKLKKSQREFRKDGDFIFSDEDFKIADYKEKSLKNRMTKQIFDMLEEKEETGERIAMLTVHQYLPDGKRPYKLYTGGDNSISKIMGYAWSHGLESWKLNCEFTDEYVRFNDLTRTR